MDEKLADRGTKDSQTVENLDHPHGLQYVATIHGGPPSVQMMPKDAREEASIYPGDVVRVKPNGNLSAKGTPGEEEWAGVSLNHGAGSTTSEHLVIVDPFANFEAQDNGKDNGFRVEASGMYANLELNDGNPKTLTSGHEIDCSTLCEEADRDIRIIGLYESPFNNPGPNARIEVSISKHLYGSGVPKATRRSGRPSTFESKSAFDLALGNAIRITLVRGKLVTETVIATEMGKFLRKEEFSYRDLRHLLNRYYPTFSFKDVLQEFL